VRNRRDGSVERCCRVRLRGAAVIAWARRGPTLRASTVAERGAGRFDRPYAGFELLPTL
jgi:hypothetical protein